MALYDLLKPVAERPVTFSLGTREYDPVTVGYTKGLQPSGAPTAIEARG